MLKKTILKKIKEILLIQKKALYDSLSYPDDVDTGGDEVDEIQGNLILSINNKLHSRNKEKLLKINDALKRIEDKSYGLCSDCREEISEKRLLLNPHFTICISCAEEKESAN
jgi:DnaK suppressor protein